MPSVESLGFDFIFPLDFFAGGIRDLTSALVEELRDEDRFANLAFELLNYGIEHGTASRYSSEQLDAYLNDSLTEGMILQLYCFHQIEAVKMRQHLDMFGPLATFQVQDWAPGGVIVDVESKTFIQNFKESPYNARQRLRKAGPSIAGGQPTPVHFGPHVRV